jgi:hypothetical protein
MVEGNANLKGFLPLVDDNSLGVSPGSGGQVGFACVAMGPSYAAPFILSNWIRIRSKGDIARYLGRGPGPEQLYDLMDDGVDPTNPNEGVQEVIVRTFDMTGATAATITAVPVVVGTGTATCAGAGTPWLNRKYCIKILTTGNVGAADGDLSTATYQICDNYDVVDTDHRVWSEERKFINDAPTTTTVYLEEANAGANVKFTAGVGDDFKAGDIWIFSTACAVPTAAMQLVAYQDLIDYRGSDGFGIGGQGDTTAKGGITLLSTDRTHAFADWDDIHAKITNEWNNNQHACHFIIPVPPPTRAAVTFLFEIDTWVTLCQSKSTTYRTITMVTNNYIDGGISLCAGYACRATASTPSVTNPNIIRHQAGSMLGMLGRSKWHHSLGWVQKMRSIGVSKDGSGGTGCIYPWNSKLDNMTTYTGLNENTRIDRIAGGSSSNARMLTLRYLPGLWTGPEWDWTMADVTSDFFCIAYYQLMYAVFAQIGAYFNKNFAGSPGLTASDCALVQQAINAAILSPMTGNDAVNQPYSASSIRVWVEANVLTTQQMQYELLLVPQASKRQLTGHAKLVRSVS